MVLNYPSIKKYKKGNGDLDELLIKSNTFNSLYKLRQLKKKYPHLVFLHKVIDGALLGVLTGVIGVAIISLHYQHLWSLSFIRLESTKNLIQKSRESISLLERNYLSKNIKSKNVVKTKSSDLIYLEKPNLDINNKTNLNLVRNFIDRFFYYPVEQGY